MLTPDRYVDMVAGLIGAIGQVTSDDLGRPVPSCPAFDVGKLLEHTGGFCRIVAGRVARDEEWMPPSGTWQQSPAEEVRSNPISWHLQYGGELVAALRSSDPTEPIETWAGRRTRYFWFRRAALELMIHRFDLDNALGRFDASTMPLDVAVDGIDEFLGEFGSRAARLLKSVGDTWQFVVANTGLTFSITATPDGLALASHEPPAVVAQAAAATLHRFVWGRAAPDDLKLIAGDAALLTRWHETVRI